MTSSLPICSLSPALPDAAISPSFSVLFCSPSAASLTHSQLCDMSLRKKNHLPDLPKTCLVLGRFSLFLPFFSFSPSFNFAAKKLCNPFFRLFPPTAASMLHFFHVMIFLLHFSSISSPFASSELATFFTGSLNALGSFPWLSALGVLRSPP